MAIGKTVSYYFFHLRELLDYYIRSGKCQMEIWDFFMGKRDEDHRVVLEGVC